MTGECTSRCAVVTKDGSISWSIEVVADPPPCVVTLRNVGFPRPECRVTAPISAVWWPQEEATEILAWRKKKEGRRRWERQDWIVSGFALKLKNAKTGLLYVCLGETPPCLCAGVSPPLGGWKTGFGECRSSVAKLAKSERLGGERRDKISPFPVNVI